MELKEEHWLNWDYTKCLRFSVICCLLEPPRYARYPLAQCYLLIKGIDEKIVNSSVDLLLMSSFSMVELSLMKFATSVAPSIPM